MKLTMNTVRIVSLSALLLITPGAPADAHSWYPEECCSQYDCMPADAINADGRGMTIVSVGHHRISIPTGLKPRASPDSRIHICFQSATQEFGDSYLMPICLFLPPQS